MHVNDRISFDRSAKAAHQSPATRRRRLTCVTVAATLFGAGFILPTSGGTAGAVLTVNEPPVTGTIVSFPARDFISAASWASYPFVDVEVLRGGQRVGIAHNLAPEVPSGLVEVNHPGGACWDTTTPNIVGGDVVRVTALDAAGVPVFVDQTTTAKINVTATVHGTGPGRVEMSGTAFNLDGTPMPVVQLEAGALSGSQARFTGGDFVNQRLIRTVAADTLASVGRALTTDGAGNWTAIWTELNAVDMALALDSESQISWIGGGTGSTIFEVGAAIAPGPFTAACNAPLAGPAVSTNVASVLLPATTVGSASAASVVRVTNAGFGTDPSTNLVVSSVASNSDQFAVTNTCAGTPVAVGAGCDVSIVFNPTSVTPSQLKNATITILSNAGNSTVSIDATGYALNAGQLAAVLVAQPTTLDFGTRASGNTSPEQSISILNIGNVSAANATGTFAGSTDFAGTAGCAEIQAGQSCTGTITFTPGGEGPRSGSLDVSASFTDENGATQSASASIPLTGQGLLTGNIVPFPHDPIALESFIDRDFVSLLGFEPGEVVTVQIIRHGVVIGNASSIAAADGIAEVNHPGGQCWEGTTPDIRANDVLRVTRADGRVYVMTNADVRVTQKARETSAGSGIVAMRGYARDLATGGPLALSSIEARLIASSRNPFAINGRRALTSADALTHATLTFDPVDAVTNPDGANWTATWDFNASPNVAADIALAGSEQNRLLWLGRDPVALTELTFAENAPAVANGPSAPCAAPAEAPSAGIAVMTPSNTFPALGVGTTGDRTYSVRNIGTAPLAISSITFAGSNPGDFSLVGAVPATVAPGSNATFTVRFSPQVVNVAGARSAIVQINDNAVGSPHTAMATGLAVRTVVPSALMTPASLTFGDTQVGVTSDPQIITVTNEGAADLEFAGIGVSNTTVATSAIDFHVNSDAADACKTTQTVPAGGSCTITATFTPSAVNNRSATLTISTNDPGGDKVATLTGSSSISVDGAFDPPRLPHALSVFPARDAVAAAGYAADEVVTVEAWRNGVMIGQSDALSPGVGGLVEVNHLLDTGCWANGTPDLQAGDIIRAVARLQTDPNEAIVSMDQIHVQGLEIDMPATAINANTVVMTGTAVDTFTGLPLAAGSFQPRITTKTINDFSTSGRQDLRAGAGLQGSVTMTGKHWTATFSGLTAADIDLAVNGRSAALWLGRIPASLNETSHAEWDEIAGPSGGCPAAGNLPDLAAISLATVAPASLNTGFSGVGLTGSASDNNVITFTNTGSVALSGVTVGAVEGLNPGDFSVSSTTCGATVAADESCTVTITFKATALGTRLASIPITHSGQNAVSHIVVSGIGVAAPTVTTISSGVAGRGTAITITGTGLTASTAVSFTASGQAVQAAASFTVVNDTTITAVIPADLAGGTLAPVPTAVSITTQGGAVTVAGGVGGLTVNGDPPNISTLSAIAGVAGNNLTITGTRFIVGATTVTIGGAPATISAASATSITVVVPAAANTTAVARPTTVAVTTINGTASRNYTVNASPRLTSFSVASAARGRAITLRGTAFTATSTVTFRTAAGTAVAASVATATRTSTALTVTVPATAVQGLVTVTTTGFAPTALEFVVATAPTITSFTPTAGPATGTATITVTGNNFRTATKVSVGGKDVVAFIVTSPTTLVINGLSTTSRTGTITVRTSFGTVNSAANFAVVSAPTITSFTPAITTLTLNPVITVTGTNFVAGTTVALVQGTRVIPTPATLAANGARLTFRLALGTTPGLYNIRVTNAAGVVLTLTNLRVNS